MRALIRYAQRGGFVVSCAMFIVLMNAGCTQEDTKGIFRAATASTTVLFDFYHKPLPNIPMPNDVATRYDKTSATGRRINASLIAGTEWESETRELADGLDGWGTMPSITIPFSGPLDVNSITSGHRDAYYDFTDDVLYLINVDPTSSEFGMQHHLDVGQGSYPVILKDRNAYWNNDPRVESLSLVFEEYDEDQNSNGELDGGEDTDSDGVLDKPNYYPGLSPDWNDLAARADALMTFYEKQSNTLIVRPLVPLRERTTYAVLVTNRIKDSNGEKIGSPFAWVNHTSQSKALEPLYDVLPESVSLSEIAFAFSFTTQSVQTPMKVVREGLYGIGPQKHLANTPTDMSLRTMRDASFFPGLSRDKLFSGEDWSLLIPLLGGTILPGGANSKTAAAITDAVSYIDFFTTGTFKSPQLRKTFAEDGSLLGPNKRIWPEDLHALPAKTYDEDITFTLIVPRKEVSARKDGKPAPLVVFTHGHTSNRAEMLITSIWFAKYGFAAIGIDAPGHGIVGDDATLGALRTVLASFGLGQGADGLLAGRQLDINGDGLLDSGEGFFTSHLFHTRDNVRQYVLDLMQLIRVIKTFDGQTTWNDVDGDGNDDLAGDVDGDGILDVSFGEGLGVFGGSMGGMAAMILAGVEPSIKTASPLVGGGMLGDIGYRSNHGVAPGGFFLQGVMGPFWLGNIGDDGAMEIHHLVENRARASQFLVGRARGVEPGDVMVVNNRRTGVLGCAYVLADGSVRAQNEVDYQDPVDIYFVRNATIKPGLHCHIEGGDQPFEKIDTFIDAIDFKGRSYEAGAPLLSLGHGLGRKRSDPHLRRLRLLSQLILDPADPVNFARHVQLEPLLYPSLQQSTGAHILATNLLGDMAVPNSAGIAWARAAGIIDYLNDDSRFNKPMNQVLIDMHVTEGVSDLKRAKNSQDEGVLLDIENFSIGMEDKWGEDYPRTDTPLRIGFDKLDVLGGKSTMVFPLTHQEGEHVFREPGGMTDDAIADCEWECFQNGNENCECDDIEIFDAGFFILNFVGRWFASGGKTLDADLCNARNNCDDIPPNPLPRPLEERL